MNVIPGRHGLGALRREQDGQTLVLTVIVMFAVLLIAAYAIDTAVWYQKHHQAQVAADAASLAAAHCLATAGTGKACSSSTDTTSATQVAQRIAAANGVTIPASDVNVGGGTVTVTTPNPAPSLFATVAGINGTVPTAHAVASFSTAAAASPYVIFGMDNTNCAHYAVNQTAGSWTINGGVHSNTSLFLDPGGSTYAQLTFGSVAGTACSVTTEGGGGTYKSGPATNGGYISTWPVPYNTAADPLPACTDTYTGTGTWQLPSPSSQTTPHVYCYPNGTIQLTGFAYDDDTFICGTLEPQGGGITIDAEHYPTNKLLVYATDTGNAFNFGTGGSINFEGDIDVPNGTLDINAGSETYHGLLEAQTVILGGGGSTVDGDGPAFPGTGSGSDSLTQ